MKKYCFTYLLCLACLTVNHSALAEDIDLFIGADTTTTTTKPNVLFIVDNTANWNTAFTNEMAALVNTFNSLPNDEFRIGVMFANETGDPNNNVEGGYVRAAIRLMDSATKTKYAEMINNLDKLDDKGNGGKSSLVMAEAYYYFKGLAPFAGNGKVKTDYLGNLAADNNGTAASKTAMKAIYDLPGNALTSKNGTPYTSPVTDGCQKNYIIYISNGPSQDNNSVISDANSRLTAAGGSITEIPLSPNGSQNNPIDEWVRFMKQSPLGVVTYTINIDPVSTGQGPGWTAILKSMASISGGKYVAVNSSSGSNAIADGIKSALSEIQSVNSVFAAVSLPVSVNTQGTYLNQVFVGMFRPDAFDQPRWAGNLKQYRLGLGSNNTIQLLDALGTAAINQQTGFIGECARSFWTPSAVDTYWAFQPSGSCLPPSGQASDYYMNSNSPDGNIVEKGAQAYKLRSSTSRNIFTCAPTFSTCATTSALTTFDTSNVAITYDLLGLPDTTDRTKLIDWARGLDKLDENINANLTEHRPSIHGDVVHSRPIAINYGTDTAPSVVIFYGANDGMLRAINGSRTNSIISGGNTYTAGSEFWSFVPPESYSVFKRNFDNNTKIKTPSITTGTPTPLPKTYVFDGPITAYKDSTDAWIYAAMRRGGRVVYAFDVTTPASPTLKWKQGCPSNFPNSGTVSDTDCSTGFSGIGQTWSSAKPLKAAGYGSGASPMIIMGGGYDTCEDADPNACVSGTTKGNHIYVMDADTGNLLTTLDTDRAVAADISIVPDSAGLAIYGYAVDLGGNVYRITMGSAAPASWSIAKIASLGCTTTASCTDNRKFMFAPDVVDEGGIYYILVGSGDREKPLNGTYYPSAYATNNYFFMIKDKPLDATWLSSESATCGSNVICLDSLYGITTNTTPVQSDIDAKKGWYLGMASHEQTVTSAITIFGTVTFSTHIPYVPAAGTCSPTLGTANVYNISYLNAAASDGSNNRSQALTGGGLPPSPVAGLVTLDSGDGTTDSGIGGGQTVPFCIGCNPASALEGGSPTSPSSSSLTQSKTRPYWYIQQ